MKVYGSYDQLSKQPWFPLLKLGELLMSLGSKSTSNTRDSVSSGYPNTEKSWKYDAPRSILDEIRGVWIAQKTLSQVFDRSS